MQMEILLGVGIGFALNGKAFFLRHIVESVVSICQRKAVIGMRDVVADKKARQCVSVADEMMDVEE